MLRGRVLLLLQVRLVAHEQDGDVGTAVLFDFVKPRDCMLERVSACDIEDYEGPRDSLVISPCD